MTDYATWTDEQVDIALAERLYGWTEVRSDRGRGRISGIAPGEPDFRSTRERPTRSASAMLGVIDAMGKRGWWCRIQSPWEPGEANPVWSAAFQRRDGRSVHGHQAAKPMFAVAVAALMALDAEQ